MAVTTDRVPVYQKPAVAVLCNMNEAGRKYTYRATGKLFDKFVVALGLILMVCDLIAGRVTHPLFIAIILTAIWLCLLGSTCRAYWPELGGEDDPGEGE